MQQNIGCSSVVNAFLGCKSKTMCINPGTTYKGRRFLSIVYLKICLTYKLVNIQTFDTLLFLAKEFFSKIHDVPIF